MVQLLYLVEACNYIKLIDNHENFILLKIDKQTLMKLDFDFKSKEVILSKEIAELCELKVQVQNASKD